MEYARSYVLSPNPPGQAESHLIPKNLQARPLANIPIGEAQAAAKLRVKQPGTMFNPALYGAKKIGGGAYGTAYNVRITPIVLERLRQSMSYGGGRVVKGYPSTGKEVVVKVVKQRRGMSDQEFFKDNVRENTVHKILSSSGSAIKIPNATKGGCISEHVPNFYMSYIIGSPGKHESVTVMDVAGNTDLNKYVKNKKIPVKMYVEIERAICCLWLAGYIHGDLHRENIMINTRTFQVKLIDFGFATKLPPNFVAVLARKMSNMISRGSVESLGDVWTDKPLNGKMRLVNYTNRVMAGRGYPWYNPDYKILRTLYNQVPRNLRSTIPAERSRTWGIKIQQNPRGNIRRPSPFKKTPVLSASKAKTYHTAGKRSKQSTVRPQPARPQTTRPKTARPPLSWSNIKARPQTTQPKTARSQAILPRSTWPKTKQSLSSRSQTRHQATLSRSTWPKTKQLQTAVKMSPSGKSSSSGRTSVQQTPLRRSSIFSPIGIKKLSNAERASIYAGSKKVTVNTAIANLEKRKYECKARGLTYNPIIRQCVTGSPMQSKSYKCREDCARIGKKCGPRGKCVKL
ncbi:Ser/Thr-protein kinase [Only Syngen Nebraska virus 5]|uniref:Ser/Thr-protein kinase n=1 Tax=Only Syngen Nebraska virus 5 TaxID=1917232 RepID=UPI0009013136|nr:Ser/Thr-protein kinase [Only Syngen Nebraska virus 5]APC25833.1 Ser/Thr-protein kinase [Only Syngen Nebraska virus 5]